MTVSVNCPLGLTAPAGAPHGSCITVHEQRRVPPPVPAVLPGVAPKPRRQRKTGCLVAQRGAQRGARPRGAIPAVVAEAGLERRRQRAARPDREAARTVEDQAHPAGFGLRRRQIARARRRHRTGFDPHQIRIRPCRQCKAARFLRLQQRAAGPQRQDRHADPGPPAARRAVTAFIGHGHLTGAVAECAPDGEPVGERQTQIGMHPGQRRVHPVAPTRRPGALSGAAGQGNPGEQGAAFVIRPEEADQAVAAHALHAVEPQRRRLSPTRPASARPGSIPGREQERAAGKQITAVRRPRVGQGSIFLAESVEAAAEEQAWDEATGTGRPPPSSAP